MRPNSKLWYKLAVLLLALILIVPILAACDDDDDDDKTTTATATETAEPTATTSTTTTAPTPTEVPDSPTGTLRVGLSGLGSGNHDPLNTDQTSAPLLDMIYDPLIGTTWDQTDIGVDAGLATGWEQGADHRSWIITLRQGMQWDQGYGEITAEDVKFSLDTNIFGDTNNDFRTQQQAMVKDIEVVDPYTVRINTHAGAPELPYMFSRLGQNQAYIACKKAVEEMGIEDHGLNPVGSGPYRIAGRETGSYFEYEAREDYWGRTPRSEEVYLYTVPEESTRVAMLKRGEVDMITEVTIVKASGLEKDGFQVIEKEGSTMVFLIFHNTWEGALANLKVRRALEMAVDREEIAEFLFEGKATPANDYTWMVGLTPENGATLLPFDPQQAEELLAQAGYADGFDLSVVVRPGGNHAIICEAMAGYWEAIGINTELKPMDMGSWLSAWMGGGLKDTVTVNETPNKIFPSLGNTSAYSTSPLATVRDPQMDAILDLAASAETMEELIEANITYSNFAWGEKRYGFFAVEYGYLSALDPEMDTMSSNHGGKSPFGWGQRQLLCYK